MKLIVGLGNPGTEYANTRHNLGYMVLEELAKEMKVSFSPEKKLKADVSMFVHDSETLILAKPTTFMNLSGDSVAKIAKFYQVEQHDIWVVSDDIDLDFGKIRVRTGGSSGGHNGLADIIEKVGENFIRFRVGVKNPKLIKIPADKFVLQKFSETEQEALPKILLSTCMLIHEGLEKGIEHSSHRAE